MVYEASLELFRMALFGSPIRVCVTAHAGRGVVAAVPLRQGQILYGAEPAISHPTVSEDMSHVCHWCLKWGSAVTIPGIGAGRSMHFCSGSCAEKAAGTFAGIQRKIDTRPFFDACVGANAALLAGRAALMRLGVETDLVLRRGSGLASRDSVLASLGLLSHLCRVRTRAPGDSANEATTATVAGQHDSYDGAHHHLRDGGDGARARDDGIGHDGNSGVLDSAVRPGGATGDEEKRPGAEGPGPMGNPGSTSGNCGQAGALAAAGAAVREGLGQEWRGAPAAWIEAYAALRGAIGEAFGAHAALQRSLTESVTAEWFLGMAARAHLNAFRVELPRPVASMDEGSPGPSSFARMLEAAAAGTVAEAGEREGSGHRAGSAMYLVPSMFNHACEPNVDVLFPRGDAKMEMRARRDIDAGEELTITYTDSSLATDVRRQHLLQGYGFLCQCPLCTEGS